MTPPAFAMALVISLITELALFPSRIIFSNSAIYWLILAFALILIPLLWNTWRKLFMALSEILCNPLSSAFNLFIDSCCAIKESTWLLVALSLSKPKFFSIYLLYLSRFVLALLKSCLAASFVALEVFLLFIFCWAISISLRALIYCLAWPLAIRQFSPVTPLILSFCCNSLAFFSKLFNSVCNLEFPILSNSARASWIPFFNVLIVFKVLLSKTCIFLPDNL